MNTKLLNAFRAATLILLMAFLLAPATIDPSGNGPQRTGVDIAGPNLRLTKSFATLNAIWEGRHDLGSVWTTQRFMLFPAAKEMLLALGLVAASQIIFLSCSLRRVSDLLRWRIMVALGI